MVRFTWAPGIQPVLPKMRMFKCMILAITILGSLHLSQGSGEAATEETCFDGPFDNVGVEGCLGDCEDYDTLEEAQTLCLSNPACSGVTHAAYGDDEAISAGIGLYELRRGPGLVKAPGDRTWIKQAWCKDALTAYDSEHIDNFDRKRALALSAPIENEKEDFENDEDSWDYEMEQVGKAYSQVFFNMLYVASFLALAVAGIGLAYCSGDASTIAIVDGCVERVRSFIIKRGPRHAGDSSYESL